MRHSRADLSIVVPVFNEERVLAETLPKVLEIAAAFGECEVMVVDDGSTDETLRVAGEILEGYPRSELIWHPRNRGKGAAVKSGVARARGRNILFVDADLSPDLDTGLGRAVACLERSPVAIASRAVEGAEVIGATALRRLLGLGFTASRRMFLDLEVADTQCGLKAFRAGAAKVLFHYATSNGFVFDVEVLLTARKLGVPVVEFPIRWVAVEPSSIRPFRDGARMAADLLRLRYVPGRPPPVPCIKIPLESSKRPDPRSVADSLRHGDLVVSGDDEIMALLFCSAMAPATSVAARLSGLVEGRDLEVSPMSPHEAARYAKAALASEESYPQTFFV